MGSTTDVVTTLDVDIAPGLPTHSHQVVQMSFPHQEPSFDGPRGGRPEDPRRAPLPQVPPSSLLTPAEAAAVLHVDANTLARWSKAGKLAAVRTPGGHRRYLAAEVARMVRQPDRRSQPQPPRPRSA